MRINENILNDLQNEIVKNVNMINFIENYTIDIIWSEGASILVRGKSDENWIYISSSSEHELQLLLEKCEGEEYFAGVEDWMLPYICEGKIVDWKLSCIKLFLPQEKVLHKTKYEVRELRVNDAEYIYNNSKYKDYTTLDYIKERIKNGISLGIYEGKSLVAWIMTHDDGAIGFLNVLEEYRNKRYGYSLTVSIIERVRKIRKIPFVHIEENNRKSMNLATKVGFVRDRKVHWIKRINNF